MNSKSFSNSKELRTEIIRLRGEEAGQKLVLAARFHGPSAIFATVKSMFPKNKDGETAGRLFHPDLLKMASRFVIPFVLDKTVFRHANFLVKSLVALISQKAAGIVSENAAEGLLAKGKSLFNNLNIKKV